MHCTCICSGSVLYVCKNVIMCVYIIINLFSNALYAMESLWQSDHTSLLNEVQSQVFMAAYR